MSLELPLMMLIRMNKTFLICSALAFTIYEYLTFDLRCRNTFCIDIVKYILKL